MFKKRLKKNHCHFYDYFVHFCEKSFLLRITPKGFFVALHDPWATCLRPLDMNHKNERVRFGCWVVCAREHDTIRTVARRSHDGNVIIFISTRPSAQTLLRVTSQSFRRVRMTSFTTAGTFVFVLPLIRDINI